MLCMQFFVCAWISLALRRKEAQSETDILLLFLLLSVQKIGNDFFIDKSALHRVLKVTPRPFWQ